MSIDLLCLVSTGLRMKFDELIAYHTRGTTLNAAGVKGFLRTPPHYYQWGVSHQIDSITLRQLDATDLFEFHLRYYLIGRHKTLQAVVREVRRFTDQDPIEAYHLITFSLALTRQGLLNLEWYELLLRLEIAKKTVLPLFTEQDYSVKPLLIRFLEESY